MANLHLSDGRVVPVVDGMTLGRVAGCTVVLEDEKVSRKHARIVIEAGVAEVEDLGSRNGVFLNGNRVLRRLLRDGDVLTVGRLDLVYREAAEAAAPAGGPQAGEDLLGGEDLLDDAPRPEPARAPEPERREPAPPPDVEVIEFVDEVVEVRRREEPAPAKPAAGRAAPAPRKLEREGGVLQFQRQQRGGALDEDVGQLGGLSRTLIVLGGLAVAAAAAWLVMTAVA